MNTSVITLRKRWPVLASILVLMAVALAAGTLFAANERQQSESEIVAQQPVADAVHPSGEADLPAAPPAPERVPVQPDDNEEEESDLPPITKVPPAYPNLDSNLNRLAEQAQAAGQENDSADGDGGSTATSASAPPEPVLVTFYIEPDQVAAVRQFLEDNDVFIRHVGEDWIEAHVPPALLAAASELSGVRRVDTVIPHEPEQSSGRVVSQGVALHHADAWHRMGYRGQGVKVGIIDGGFERFSELQRNRELPANVTARCYSYENPPQPVSSSLAACEIRTTHGTRVGEAVIDVAPEVELYIANPRSDGDMRDAVDWMIQNGVDVINRSLASHYEGPGDGTYWSSLSGLASIDTAVSGGIVFVNSTGNYAERAWYGAFNDPDGNGHHNFTSRDYINTVYLREGSNVTVLMRWEDTWGGADCDLDLYLVRNIPGPDNDFWVDRDIINQDGDTFDIPRAHVSFTADSPHEEGYYYIVIIKDACAGGLDWMQFYVPGGSPRYYNSRHSINGMSESRNPGMLAVAAAHWESPQAIASYSSRGPAVDGRIKPDITGIACGRTSLRDPYSRDGTECWFSGTSQAAPHVAGLAALVRQRFPHYTPAQVAAYLKKHADDHERGPLGADNTWGHGLATLPPGPEPMLRGSEPITDFDVRPGENPDEVVISWVPVPEATNYRIGYVNLEVDYNLFHRDVTCTKENDDWLQAFVYVDVKAPNVPIRDGRAEYTIRRLSSGAAHAYTVLTSNNLYNNRLNVGAEFTWPELGPRKERWINVDGRNTLPPSISIPQLDCNP